MGIIYGTFTLFCSGVKPKIPQTLRILFLEKLSKTEWSWNLMNRMSVSVYCLSVRLSVNLAICTY